MINVAIVGFGLSGRYLQAPLFEANPNFTIKMILSNSQNPQQLYPKVTVAKTIEEILADETIDLVSICSPNNTHYPYAKLALQAGKHVLVEKPLTSSSREAIDLIKTSKESNKILSVFQNRRFDSDFLTVKKLLNSGRLGEILNFEINYNRYKPELNIKKWKETSEDGSGTIFDLGAHIIDQAISLFGIPQNIWGQSFTQRKNSVIQDAFDIKLNYGKLKVTLRSSLLVREPSPRYIIHGTNGSFVKFGIDVQEDHLKAGMQPGDTGFGIEPATQQGILYTEKGDAPHTQNIETLPGNWKALFQNLYEAIVHGKELLVKPEQVLEQIKIIEAVIQ
ncbi:MAG: Gfo/Idh/MocA family oxidoreductase [Ferruginibacter sp.]